MQEAVIANGPKPKRFYKYDIALSPFLRLGTMRNESEQLMSDEAASSLGEKLLQGVLNLWSEVNGHGKVLDYHGQEIEALKTRMRSLESQVHGLKSTKGKAIASNTRLRAAVTEAEDKLQQIESQLN